MKKIVRKRKRKKYKFTNGWRGKIERVEVSHETKKMIFFEQGGRCSKLMTDVVFFDTPEEVYEWLKKKLKSRQEHCKLQYDIANDEYMEFIEKGIVWTDKKGIS